MRDTDPGETERVCFVFFGGKFGLGSDFVNFSGFDDFSYSKPTVVLFSYLFVDNFNPEPFWSANFPAF